MVASRVRTACACRHGRREIVAASHLLEVVGSSHVLLGAWRLVLAVSRVMVMLAVIVRVLV